MCKIKILWSQGGMALHVYILFNFDNWTSLKMTRKGQNMQQTVTFEYKPSCANWRNDWIYFVNQL
jgi:hypothetical protein